MICWDTHTHGIWYYKNDVWDFVGEFDGSLNLKHLMFFTMCVCMGRGEGGIKHNILNKIAFQ